MHVSIQKIRGYTGRIAGRTVHTAILLSLALPAFADVVRRVQSETVVNSLANAYQLGAQCGD
ncbi:MAG: hypothetical protein IPK95_13405 [Cellvibrionales bacterium]|nr:hypothetical protein [Cellvibrionales bacterium]